MGAFGDTPEPRESEMKFKLGVLLAVAGLLALAPTVTRANNIAYSFSGCPDSGPCSGAIASSVTYTSGGITITATGYSTASTTTVNTTTALYIKTDAGDEHGLGISSPDADHEIEPGQFIQLTLTNLANAGVDTGNLFLGSVQSGEEYKICEGGSAGVMGTVNCITGGLDETAVPLSWSKSDPYIDITVPTDKGDVLVSSLTSTPEPGTAGLMLLGISAMMLITLRRRFASSTN